MVRRLLVPGLALGFGCWVAFLSHLAHASGDDRGVPAYHAQAPHGALPATLDPAQFRDQCSQEAYAVAAKIKRVLYQQPCYCYCDRGVGHGSLLDCFTGDHAATCIICKKEALYSYEETKNGKSPAEIRVAIMKGEWQKVNLEQK